MNYTQIYTSNFEEKKRHFQSLLKMIYYKMILSI